MLRTFLELGPIKIYSYGTMLMLAFGFGILLALQRTRKREIPPEDMMDLSTLLIVSAIVGARLLYIFSHLGAYSGRWSDIFKVWEGGLTLYGGVVLAVLASIWFCRRRGLSFIRIADTVAPSMALGVGITRIGCFLNGCCFGKTSQLPWAVGFPDGSLAHHILGGIPIHPSQIYASIVGFAITLVLLQVDRHPRRDGLLFWLFLLFFGGATALTDFSRYWEDGATILDLGTVAVSANQLLELGLVVVAVAGLTGLTARKEGGGRGRESRRDGSSKSQLPG